jgi:hypothetical protein
MDEMTCGLIAFYERVDESAWGQSEGERRKKKEERGKKKEERRKTFY